MAGCFERVPYASVIACVLILTGAGIMCGTNYEAFRRVGFLFDQNFYPIESHEICQNTGIVLTAVTLLLSTVNVSFGAITTGETRRKLYPHKKAQSSGKSYALVLSVFTYMLISIWLLLFIAFTIPVSLWAMLHSVCYEETEYWRRLSADKDETLFSYTFNLTNYGLYRRPLDTSLYSESINSPSAFTQLCQEISTIGPLFAIALISSFLVILGLLSYIACLANASVRLELSHELDQIHLFAKSPNEVAIPLLTNQLPQSHPRMDVPANTFSYTGNVYHHRPAMSGAHAASFAVDPMQQQSSGFQSLIRN